RTPTERVAPGLLGFRGWGMGRLDGKVALITGAARGQGAAEARVFAAEGASVVLTDVLDDDGYAVAAEIGATARYQHHDVTDEDAWQRAVALAVTEFGRLDILVNNAGISLPPKPIIEGPVAASRHVLEVNLISMYTGIKYAAPQIIRAGGGSIVNVSSV